MSRPVQLAPATPTTGLGTWCRGPPCAWEGPVQPASVPSSVPLGAAGDSQGPAGRAAISDNGQEFPPAQQPGSAPTVAPFTPIPVTEPLIRPPGMRVTPSEPPSRLTAPSRPQVPTSPGVPGTPRGWESACFKELRFRRHVRRYQTLIDGSPEERASLFLASEAWSQSQL